MKRTISTLSIFVLIALFSATAIAQPGRGNRGQQANQRMLDIPAEVRSEAHIAVFDEYLKLSDTQKEQIKTIDKDFSERGKELREASINRQRRMVEMRDLRNEHQQALHKILSKDQYAVYLEKKESIQYDIRQRLRAYSDKGNK
ncbi:MAG: hypothetical protein JJ966_12340 [Balneolaceae bacterium]|nr:hypothetical protein [Balneolaceae bacterium]